jgi:hypothetical protein
MWWWHWRRPPSEQRAAATGSAGLDNGRDVCGPNTACSVAWWSAASLQRSIRLARLGPCLTTGLSCGRSHRRGSQVTQLRDKPVWFFGPHPKGGGCDWHVAAQGVKLVAQLRLQPHVDTGAVVATLRSMHPKLPGCEVTIGGAQLDDKRAEYVLHHDDELCIAGVAFRFDRGAPLPPGDVGPPPRPLQKRVAPAAASAPSRAAARATPSVTTASHYRGHGKGAPAVRACFPARTPLAVCSNYPCELCRFHPQSMERNTHHRRHPSIRRATSEG